MQECVWKNVEKRNLQSSISSLLYDNVTTQEKLLNAIMSDGVYGFCLVDIEPTPLAQKFVDINWLPIIRHDEIYFEDLPNFMRKKNLQKSFPRKTLVQTMHAKKILLHTRLIQWYCKNGFKITNIHHMFEYQKASCYRHVHDRVYEARVAATIERNNKKATAIKLVSNSMYGQMIMVCHANRIYIYIY